MSSRTLAPAVSEVQEGYTDSLVIEDLEPGAEYEVHFCAENTHGKGQYSKVVGSSEWD